MKDQVQALKLFHEAAIHIPAYKDFLKKHKLQHKKIKTIEDFQLVPVTSKKNYIKKYPLQARCWEGKLAKQKLLAMSSGMSGEPTFWPRGTEQEKEAVEIHELLYRTLFHIDKYRTLLVIAFPMGVYVSGVATLIPSFNVAQKYSLTILAAGPNKQEIITAIQYVQDDYEQIVLVGHPFFIKDVLETGKEQGVKWEKKKIGMMFCSEGFSEEWRKYILSLAGKNATAISTYGSAEFLLMAWETPLSILARKIIQEDQYRKKLFLRKSEPSLFQYNPLLRYIETKNGELLFTVNSGIPLIRYNIHDSGRILSFEKVMSVLKKSGQKIPPGIQKLPFLALWGRSDQTIIFYAANIYPEHVRQALDRGPFLKKLTGKFIMRKDYTKDLEEFLEINIELRTNVKPSITLKRALQKYIFQYLRQINMEFLDLSSRHVGDRAIPRIKLWPYQNQKYFKPGLKPRYITSD